MIFTSEPDGSCAGRDSKSTNSQPSVAPPSAQGVTWKVQMPIIAVIEVSGLDAATEDEARAFAIGLANGLPLKVTMGGVPLDAKFACKP